MSSLPNADFFDYFPKLTPGLIVIDHGTLRTDRTGLDTCTAIYECKVKDWKTLPQLNGYRQDGSFGPTTHPIFNWIGMENRVLSFRGPFARIECNYAGIQYDATGSLPVYELIVGLEEAPIDTHPDFIAKIGGTAKAPKNGAVFRFLSPSGAILYASIDRPAQSNSGHVFDHFVTMIGDQLNDFAKMETYLEASQMTWKKTWNLKVPLSSVTTAGKIDVPDGNPPALRGKANWLNMGISQTKRGTAYQATQEWRASGRRGWNAITYA